MSDFEKCVVRYLTQESTVYNIDCKLGLWGVQSESKTYCESQAFHYWQQYANDGEYSRFIGGKTVLERLNEVN